MNKTNKIKFGGWSSLSRLSQGITLAASLALSAMVPVAQAGVAPLQTSGNQIHVNGEPASFAGASLFWSNNGWGGENFYNAGAVKWIKDDWGATLIRAAMGVDEVGGYNTDKAGNVAKVEAVVDAAIANDMYVIIDFHTHHAEDNVPQAIEFFTDMARKYGGYNNVIYEVYNEPIDSSWDNDIKPYAEEVISVIREIDPDNLIIVGTRFFSQRVDEASRNPINDVNVAYTLHFYANGHRGDIRGFAQEALNNGIPLFVTEWGTVEPSGAGGVDHGETDIWMDFLRQNNISHANWALNSKDEGSSALPPGSSGTGGWTNLTESGAKVKELVQGWPQYDFVGDFPSGGGGAQERDCDRVDIPGTIQGEEYCGAQGIRTEDTEDTGGGENIAYTDPGDWIRYDINVEQAGTYELSLRVASQDGGVVRVEEGNGENIYAEINVDTGGYQIWETVTQEIELSAGEQTFTLVVAEGAWNLNWFELSTVGGGNATPEPQPATPTPAPVDAEVFRVEAEDFTAMDGLELEDTEDTGGGQNIGYIDEGDTFEYDVILPVAGSYEVSVRVASDIDGGASFEIYDGNEQSMGVVDVPSTGGWQTWETVQTVLDLEENNKLRMVALSDGFNVNWFEFKCVAGCSVDGDNDGVLDGVDLCPNTPAGTSVGADGCENDADGDGVGDANDQCPNTPANASGVDVVGCSDGQQDSDNDGVANSGDQCPNTAVGTVVNGVGCANTGTGGNGENAAPTLRLGLSQGGNVVTSVDPDGGIVTINALVADTDAGDTHIFAWNVSAIPGATANGAVATFDPSGVPAGSYSYAVTVGDSGTPRQTASATGVVTVATDAPSTPTGNGNGTPTTPVNPPVVVSSGGDGGGSAGWFFLMLGGALAGRRLASRKRYI